MKKILFFLIFALSNLFAQEDIDSLFNDSSRDIKMSVTTDVMRLIYGTPNVGLETIIGDRILLNTQIGSPFFGYRENDLLFETGVVNGFEFNIGGGISFFSWEAEHGLYLGLEYENWRYSSVNADVAEGNGLGGYSNSEESDGEFRFYRKLNRFGLVVESHSVLNEKMKYFLGAAFGYETGMAKYDLDNSIGVTYNDTPKWVQGFFSKGMYFRIKAGLKFNVL